MSSENIQPSPTDNSKDKKEDILFEYTIKGLIGKGTFSIVKLGENKSTKEKVAIKIMQKNRIINKEDFIRINRELDILKSLNHHPNVIKIYKILEDSKKFYIIMEYCENGELFNRIVEKQHLNEDESALFYYQLICGLEYIHKNKIAHRDLKPENLLLSKNDILKIIDFGLSNYSNNLLVTPCGSPCYASPEMVSGRKYNGSLIDIWSTGIILFAMICGYLPFEDKNNELLFEKILKCKIKYPNYIGDLPLDLMKKILVIDPNKRITLNEIKKHPFYLKGKLLFSQKYPEITIKKQANLIKNIKPIIKNKLTKYKNKKENKGNIKKRLLDNNYIINIDHINNMNNTYKPSITENFYYNRIKNETINYDYFNNEKENIDGNRNINKKEESFSSNIKSEAIPMDSIPKGFYNDKSKNILEINNKEDKNCVKDDIINYNILSNRTEKSNTNNNNLKKKRINFNKSRKRFLF